MIPIIVLKIQYQVIYISVNLEFPNLFGGVYIPYPVFFNRRVERPST